jgi:hypothetical protein
MEETTGNIIRVLILCGIPPLLLWLEGIIPSGALLAITPLSSLIGTLIFAALHDFVPWKVIFRYFSKSL